MNEYFLIIDLRIVIHLPDTYMVDRFKGLLKCFNISYNYIFTTKQKPNVLLICSCDTKLLGVNLTQ